MRLSFWRMKTSADVRFLLIRLWQNLKSVNFKEGLQSVM